MGVLLLQADDPLRLEIPVLDRRFENAGEQHPGIPDRLPARPLMELVRDPLLNREALHVAEPPVPPHRENVHVQHSLIPVQRACRVLRLPRHQVREDITVVRFMFASWRMSKLV
jgi:hypothetical protein